MALALEDHARGGRSIPSADLLWQTLPRNEVKIIDDNGKSLAPNQTGEICSLRQQYAGLLQRPEATASTLQDGWVLTGDAGFMDEAGYLYLRDRIKDMVVSGGENIYPVEVENVLAAIPGVVEVAVIGVPDETFGEALLAIFAMKPGHSIDTEAMVAFCRDKLAGYKIPRRLECRRPAPQSVGENPETVLREHHWRGLIGASPDHLAGRMS